MSIQSKVAVDTVEELRARFGLLQVQMQKAAEVASSETSTVQVSVLSVRKSQGIDMMG